MAYDITKIDWVKYLDRETPLILFAGIMPPYAKLLYEATDGEFRFLHQFRVFAGTGGTLYLSQKEMEAADDYFSSLVMNNDPRLIIWHKNGELYKQKLESLLVEFQVAPPDLSLEKIGEIYNDYEQYLLYDIIIPFRILSCIDRELEVKGVLLEDFQKAREMFEHFRAGSLYPSVLREVFPFFYQEANQKTDLPAELGSYMTPNELFDALEGNLIVTEEELQKRKEGCSFWENPITGKIEFSFEKDMLDKLGLKEELGSFKQISGKIAFPGKVTGVVKIVNNDQSLDKVEEGDVIVSFNTNPPLMSALLKCAAMVTNEGGIMCHAAIVSRELKKPCIIGTKIATEVLKDGDTVEVDAESGIVTVIE